MTDQVTINSVHAQAAFLSDLGGLKIQDILTTLYKWLGDRAILLPLPLGKKGPEGTDWLDWQKTTFERTQEPDYQKKLAAALKRGGNIGVLLVNNLTSIDVDNDAKVDEFLELNPILSNTLQSKGYRGRQFWIRMVGTYPEKTYKLKHAGEKWGEWRGGGGTQTVIWGRHPETRPETTNPDGTVKPAQEVRYQRLVPKPVITIAFQDIVWPSDMHLPWLEKKPVTKTEPAQFKVGANMNVRIAAYVAAIPPAVSEQNGHGQTFSVALSLVKGWALSIDEAWPYMRAYSERCEPPWTDKEIAHKLQSASEASYDRPIGHLIGSSDPLIIQRAKEEPKKEVDLQAGNEQNDCPYPAIDWSSVAKQTSNNVRFHHPAIYPEDSILTPYMELGTGVCEASDCYLLGACLPVVSGLLERRVFMDWSEGGVLYTNLFSMLVGKPGDRKTSAINIPEKIAFECLPENAFLPLGFSPESMFDEYYKRPDKLWIVDDANIILTDWRYSSNGTRSAAQFLRLHDCKRLSESFRRNKSETTPEARVIPETSTSVVFGATFNIAAFQGQQIREGLARRFLYYIADKHGRVIVRPPRLDVEQISDLFKSLLALKGKVDFDEDAAALWSVYQNKNRERYEATTISQEALAGRLSSEPTHVAKVAMIFEACRCVKYGKAISAITETSLSCAIKHVAENMRSAEFLDSISQRAVIAERAEMVIAAIRRKFHVARPSTIYATKSELTYEICHQGSRQGSIKPEELYNHIIPQLEAQGIAQPALKRGKLEVFAFQTEDFQDDSQLV